MRRPQDIASDVRAMGSVVQLTGAFEGIASVHIARLKDRVARSEGFFNDLWQVYTQLRVGKEFLADRQAKPDDIDKDLLIVITSEGSLSGDIDERLVRSMLKNYDSQAHDIIVIGHHGEILLKQQAIPFIKAYKLPEQDSKIDTEEMVAEIQRYRKTTAYYQAYVSLMTQDIRSIELNKAVEERGDQVEISDGIISDANFIFEPSVMAVVEYMERSMLGVAMNELIIASKLAQQASRFRAMSAAQTKAREAETDLRAQLSHARRRIKDEQTREIIAALEMRTT